MNVERNVSYNIFPSPFCWNSTIGDDNLDLLFVSYLLYDSRYFFCYIGIFCWVSGFLFELMASSIQSGIRRVEYFSPIHCHHNILILLLNVGTFLLTLTCPWNGAKEKYKVSIDWDFEKILQDFEVEAVLYRCWFLNILQSPFSEIYSVQIMLVKRLNANAFSSQPLWLKIRTNSWLFFCKNWHERFGAGIESSCYFEKDILLFPPILNLKMLHK